MSIDISKIKAGDQVQIANGDWYEVIDVTRSDGSHGCFNAGDVMNVYINTSPYTNTAIGCTDKLITDHRPAQPEPPVEEWVTEEDVESARCLDGDLQPCLYTDDANALLTRKYGPPPIVRVYNGEPPEEFGLERNNHILHWTSDGWMWTTYCLLCTGDRWMKQPAKPGEVER